MRSSTLACANGRVMGLLDVSSLGVQYRTRRGPAHALDDVSFSLASGQVIGIVGESGCGKTTMAMALMGLLPDTATVSGRVVLDGRDVSRLSPKAWQRLRGKDIAMIFQGAMNAWNPVYTVGDQIVETIQAHEPGLRLSEARDRVGELYTAVGLDPERRDQFPHQYSGGMKQRAVIAMALACNPKLVIADEPTTALDVIVQDRILREMRRIQRERALGMVYISHDMAVVAELADVVAVMYAGRIVEMGPTSAIFARPAHPYTAALLAASPSLTGPRRMLRGLAGGPPSLVDPPPGCRFSPRCAYATDQCTASTPALLAHRDGLTAACWHPLAVPGRTVLSDDAHAGSAGPDLRTVTALHTDPAADLHTTPALGPSPLLRIASVHKRFPVGGGLFTRAKSFVHAVDDVSFDVAPGEAFGLIGESGSGKTTLGRIVVQLGEATSGRIEVRLDGSSAPIADIDRRTFRRGVQMIFQDPYESLNPRMTIADIVSEPLDVLQVDSRDLRHARVTRMLEKVGLTPAETFLHRYPHELSGGQRQRIAIARAMVVEPTFIVADEPTSMLDVSVRAGIMELLLDLKREFGVSYLYITHDLAVARHLCDRMAVMYQGKIVELGETEEVLQNPVHPYTRALIAAVPVPDPSYRRSVPAIKGRASGALDPGQHCRFLERCPIATAQCSRAPHPPLQHATPTHVVACYEAVRRPDEDAGDARYRQPS
ncbi:MAG: ABC transporter ATP-binding protein [Vicinamibacterales bacterium]